MHHVNQNLKDLWLLLFCNIESQRTDTLQSRFMKHTLMGPYLLMQAFKFWMNFFMHKVSVHQALCFSIEIQTRKTAVESVPEYFMKGAVTQSLQK